jgi:hypothetical protein
MNKHIRGKDARCPWVGPCDKHTDSEYEFVTSLWSYEALRLLYAWHGLCHVLSCDVTRVIVSLFMRCFHRYQHCPGCLPRPRYYNNITGEVNLYTTLREHAWRAIHDKPEREKQALLDRGVPEWRCILFVNEVGLPSRRASYYDDLNHEVAFRRATQYGICIPPRYTFVCLDVMDTESMWMNLNWSHDRIVAYQEFKQSTVDSSRCCCNIL